MEKYNEGMRLLENGDFAGAREKFNLGMKDGEAKCAYGAMITALHFGEEIECAEKRLQATIPILDMMARTKPDGEAFYILAQCREKGLGTTKNKNTAFAFYTQAAHLGNTDAMLYLGRHFMARGEAEKAVRFFERAAALGCMDAKHALEDYYATQEKES